MNDKTNNKRIILMSTVSKLALMSAAAFLLTAPAFAADVQSKTTIDSSAVSVHSETKDGVPVSSSATRHEQHGVVDANGAVHSDVEMTVDDEE
jgi:hypothetical protein